MKKLLIIAISPLFLWGCGGQMFNEELELTEDWGAEESIEGWDEFPETTQEVQWQSAANKDWVVQHTDLTLSFDWENHQISGNAIIEVKPYFYQQDSLVLDAYGMDILSVSYFIPDNIKVPYSDPIDYTYSDSQHLILRFPSPVTSNMLQKIKIQYIANPDRIVGHELNLSHTAVRDDKGAYFINTDNERPFIPMQFWTQGEPQSNCHWFPTIDQPNQKHTHRIELIVPDSLTTLSNGTLQSSIKMDNKMRQDIWLMDQPHSVYLTMVAIGNWVKVQDKWRDIDVDYYIEPQYESHAKVVFGNTPEMIEFFSNYTGVTYPWKKYAQVVARDFVSGAMENTTATLHREELQDSSYNYEDYISHELFHHWFGDLVTMDGFANLSMNESFATYSEYLWREYKYGKFNADLWMDENSQINPKNSPLIDYKFKHPNDLFDDIRYNRGAQILHLLRSEIGDAAFRKSIQLYLTTNSYKNGTAYDWKKCIEETTGRNMDYFFNSWYFEQGQSNISYYVDFDSINNQYELKITSVGISNIEADEVEREELVNPKAFHLEILWKSPAKSEYTLTKITLNSNEREYTLVLGEKLPEFLVVDPNKTTIGLTYHRSFDEEIFFDVLDSMRNIQLKKFQREMALNNVNSLESVYSIKKQLVASSRIGKLVLDGIIAKFESNYSSTKQKIISDSLALSVSMLKTAKEFIPVFKRLSDINDGRVHDYDLNLLHYNLLVDDSVIAREYKKLQKKFIAQGIVEQRNKHWSYMLDYKKNEDAFSNFINYSLDSNLIHCLYQPKTLEEIQIFNTLNWILNAKYELKDELKYSKVLESIALNKNYSSNFRTQAAIAHSINLNNNLINSADFYLKVLPELLPEHQYELLKNGLDYFVSADESVKPYQYELTKNIWESSWCQNNLTNIDLILYVLKDEHERLNSTYSSIDEVVSGTDRLYFALINDIFSSIED